jgi:hypothetical protein
MPNIVHNPHRLPTKAEAIELATWARRRAERDPDGDEGDHLIANLLEAWGQGLLVLSPAAAKRQADRTDRIKRHDEYRALPDADPAPVQAFGTASIGTGPGLQPDEPAGAAFGRANVGPRVYDHRLSDRDYAAIPASEREPIEPRR